MTFYIFLRYYSEQKNIIMKLTRLLAAATIIVAMLWACEKENSSSPFISDVHTSDCHTNTDKLAAKDMTTDSIVYSWASDGNSLQVTHYNMMLDCGEQNITTTVETEGNVVTVVEHVGEQGLTNCICLYDNSFTINDLPQGEFTLRIKVESIYAGTPHQTTVFEETITHQMTITHQI